MNRIAMVALLVVGLAAPAFAQRGGGAHGGGGFAGHAGGSFHGGGGFVGHAGPAFRGGYSGSSHFAAPRYGGFAAGRGYGFAGPRYARPYPGYSGSRFRSGYRSDYRRPYDGNAARGHRFDHDRDRRFRNFYGNGFFYPVPDWIGLGPVGCYPDAQIYGDDYDDYGCDDLSADNDQPAVYGGDDESQSPAPPPGYEGPSQDYGQPPPDYGQPPSGYAPPPPPDYGQPPRGYEPPAYQPPSQTPNSRHQSTNQIATTIVFNDGRPSEQIHNYALTRTTLYVLDQQRSDIPLNQINLAETEKVNRAAGIPFQIPQESR